MKTSPSGVSCLPRPLTGWVPRAGGGVRGPGNHRPRKAPAPGPRPLARTAPSPRRLFLFGNILPFLSLSPPPLPSLQRSRLDPRPGAEVPRGRRARRLVGRPGGRAATRGEARGRWVGGAQCPGLAVPLPRRRILRWLREFPGSRRASAEGQGGDAWRDRQLAAFSLCLELELLGLNVGSSGPGT